MENFVTFDRFPNREMAQALGKFLEEKGIGYVIEEDSASVDITFSGNLEKEFRLKLKPEDFEKAHAEIEASVLGELDQIPPDYYLLSFSDDELLEVVSAKDEWSAFDYMLARKLLREKGKEISADELKILEKKRIKTLSEPDKPDAFLNFLGWAAVLLGGVLGLFIGWYLSSHRKTLPNGQMIYAFAEKDRKQGKAMLAWSAVSLVFWIGLYFYLVRLD